jgi:hypothetical protein
MKKGFLVGYNKFCVGEGKIQRQICSSNSRGFNKLAQGDGQINSTRENQLGQLFLSKRNLSDFEPLVTIMYYFFSKKLKKGSVSLFIK